MDLGLNPQRGNTATQVVKIQVPAGTRIYESSNRFRWRSIDGGASIMTYDNNGNMATRGDDGFAYTPNILMRTSVTGGTTTHYAFDADDLRVKKDLIGGPTTYFLRGPNGQLLTEWVTTSPLATVRDYIYAGSRLIGVVKTELPPK